MMERLIGPITLIWTVVAAGLWYVWPELGAWPLVFGLLPWALRLVMQGRLFRRTPYDWALGLFLLTAVGSVWAAYDRETALAKFWPIVAGALLFFAISGWLLDEPEAAGMLGWLTAIFGAGVSVYFLAVHDWTVYPAKVAALTRLGQALQEPLPAAVVAGGWHRLHPNVVGGILALTAPFAGMAVWRSRRAGGWLQLGAALGLLALTLFGLLMSSSRGAWLALAGAAALALWWQALDRIAKRSQTRRRRLFAGSIGIGLAAIVAAAALSPETRAEGMRLLPAMNGVGRAALYREALALIQDYPLVGGGLDLFMMLHASYVMLLHVGFSVHSHNLYLDVAIEQGLPGLFALWWMWGMFGLVLWKAATLQRRRVARKPAKIEGTARKSELPGDGVTDGVSRDGVPEDGAAAPAAGKAGGSAGEAEVGSEDSAGPAASLEAVLQELTAGAGGGVSEAAAASEGSGAAIALSRERVDTVTAITEEQAATVDPEAEAAGQRRRRRSRVPERPRGQAGVLAAAAVSLTTVALHGLVDDALYGSRAVMLLFVPLAFSASRLAVWRAAAKWKDGDFERAKLRGLRKGNAIAGATLGLLLLVTAALPAGRSLYWSNVGAVRQSRLEQAVYDWPEWPVQDALRRELDLEAVRTAYERALALDAANVPANRRLGMIELSLGEYEQALTHLERAYEGGPWDNTTRQLFGEALIVNGRPAEGAALWRTVNNAQGQLEIRRFWYEHIGDAERLAAVKEALEGPAE